MTDRPVTAPGKQKNDTLQSKLNGGGPTLVLRASSGEIRLKESFASKPKVEPEEPEK